MNKTKTRKRQSQKYNIYQTGNILICVKHPIMVRSILKKYGGAESENEYLQNQIFQNLVAVLAISKKPEDKELNDYIMSLRLSSDKSKLVHFVFSKKSNMNYESLFDAIKRKSLNMRNIDKTDSPENKLYIALLNKVQAKTKIESIKKELAYVPDLDEKTKTSIINTLENGSGMTLSSVSSSAMNSLKKGSLLLGNMLAPTPIKKGKRWNETNIDILFYDRDNLHFKKGDSMPALPDEDRRMGDLMVITHPTQYASTAEYLSDMYGTVEDLLAHIVTPGENILCMGDSEKCKKFSAKPKPSYYRSVRFVDKQPQINSERK